MGEDPREAKARALSLKKLPSGKYLYVGTQDERFDARIERDGTVTFMVDPSFTVELGGICLVALCISRSPRRVAGRGPSKPGSTLTPATRAQVIAQRLAVGLMAGAANGYSQRSSGSDARNLGLDPYQQPGIGPYGSSQQQQPMPILGAVQGRYGYLPKPQAQMSAFLERTFEFRLTMAHEAQTERLEAALKALPVRLLDVWADDARPVADRKAELLELWADLERPPEELVDLSIQKEGRAAFDERRSAAADRARVTIEAFVRRHLPEGSPDAFTTSELERFNASRRGAERFEPYGASPP